MIKVERLDKSPYFVNPHQIEFMEETPDTIITLLSGKKIVVSTRVDEVINRIVQYRRMIGQSFAGNEL
jgi:flagellar protein FlbD